MLKPETILIMFIRIGFVNLPLIFRKQFALADLLGWVAPETDTLLTKKAQGVIYSQQEASYSRFNYCSKSIRYMIPGC